MNRPASVYALTCGCTLLLSGSLADLFGCRIMYLTGACLLIAFTMGCGLAKTGIQLIMFRAFSGIALSFCLPSATSMITKAFPVGRSRNIAFACYGAAQPLGFSLGLVLAGALLQSIGWRACYYIVTAVTFIPFLAAIWLLPRDDTRREPMTLRNIAYSVDWIGAAMASTSLGLFSYVLAVVATESRQYRNARHCYLTCAGLHLLDQVPGEPRPQCDYPPIFVQVYGNLSTPRAHLHRDLSQRLPYLRSIHGVQLLYHTLLPRDPKPLTTLHLTTLPTYGSHGNSN